MQDAPGSALALYREYASQWETNPNTDNFMLFGLYSCAMILQKPGAHWFIGENADHGAAGLVVLTFEDTSSDQVIHFRNQMFKHLEICGECTAMFPATVEKFSKLVDRAKIDAANRNDGLIALYKCYDAFWTDRIITVAKSLEISPNNTDLLRALSICLIACLKSYTLQFKKGYATLLKYFTQIEPLARSKGKFTWAPGYLALLVEAEDDSRVQQICKQRMAEAKPHTLEPSDPYFFVLLLTNFGKKYNSTELQNSEKWDFFWGCTSYYFSCLAKDNQLTKMAKKSLQIMKKCRQIRSRGASCVLDVALLGADAKGCLTQFVRCCETPHDLFEKANQVLQSSPEMDAIILDLLNESIGLNSNITGILCAQSFDKLSSETCTTIVNTHADTFVNGLVKSGVVLGATSLGRIHDIVKAGEGVQLISAIRSKFVGDAPPNANLFLMLRLYAFRPYFTNVSLRKKSQESSESIITADPTVSAESIDHHVLDILRAMETEKDLTRLCQVKGVLSCVWLFTSSPRQEASQLGENMVKSISPANLDVNTVFEEFVACTSLIVDRSAYTLANKFADFSDSILSLRDIVPIDQNAKLWDHFWTFMIACWNTTAIQKQGLPMAYIKILLRRFCLSAQKTIVGWPTIFEAQLSNPGFKSARLDSWTAAVTAGRKLLFVHRKSGVPAIYFDITSKCVQALNNNNTKIPPELASTLADIVTGKRGHELEPNEVNKLKFLLDQAGVDAKVSSPVTVGTTASSTSANARPPSGSNSNISGATPGTTQPRNGDLTRFFKVANRDDAVAATQKQLPPVPSSTPRPLSSLDRTRMSMESSRSASGSHEKPLTRLELVREQMESRPHVPPPARHDPNAVIHPPRAAGFNSREKPKKTSPVPGSASLSGPRPTATDSIIHSESSSDDDDSDSGLIRLGKKRVRNIDNTDRIGPHIGVKRALRPPEVDERAQEAARMKARKLVTANELHKTMLTWNYFERGNYPPTHPKNLKKVPDTFSSAAQYKEIMKPLLLMEAWQQIQQQKEITGRSTPFLLTVGKRENVDDFVDFHCTLSQDQYQSQKLTENDLILLAWDSTYTCHQIHPVNVHAFAKIKEGSVSVRSKTVDLVVRTYHSESFTSRVVANRVVIAEKVMSLITVEREFRAIESFEHCELRREILNAEAAPLLPTNHMAISRMVSDMGLNESQAGAAFQALNSPGINLIQGPPGTGKTKTILGIIGHYLTAVGTNRRILVCAPSNAAVDELLIRLKEGVKNAKGINFNPKLVRIRRNDAVNAQVSEFCLENLVEKSVRKVTDTVDFSLKNEISDLVIEIQTRNSKLEDTSLQLSADEVTQLEREKSDIKKQLDEKRGLFRRQQEQLDLSRKHHDAEYKRIQTEVLTNAQVVCATLSGSASAILANLDIAFPFVIIDEAAQSVESSALIPFKYGCKHCVMVGDPHQLPPTVLNRAAEDLNYGQSLFTRIFKQHQDKVSMLEYQFRMHPDISAFPSKEFYSGLLKDGPDQATKCKRPWHADPLFPPYMFYDLKSEQHHNNKSFSNSVEADGVFYILKLLFQRFYKEDFTDKIGVVTPYKQQAVCIRGLLTARMGASVFSKVTVSTIDAFQGQEKDIILFSAVRSEDNPSSIGFVGDIRRMNVAITRARSSLWILGNAATLGYNSEWSNMISDSRNRVMFSTIVPSKFETVGPTVTPQQHKETYESFKSRCGGGPQFRGGYSRGGSNRSLSGDRKDRNRRPSGRGGRGGSRIGAAPPYHRSSYPPKQQSYNRDQPSSHQSNSGNRTPPAHFGDINPASAVTSADPRIRAQHERMSRNPPPLPPPGVAPPQNQPTREQM